MFAYGLSGSVLYHFSKTGGQQLFRQTAKAHVDHIAEGLKNDCMVHRVRFLQNTRRGAFWSKCNLGKKSKTGSDV